MIALLILGGAAIAVGILWIALSDERLKAIPVIGIGFAFAIIALSRHDSSSHSPRLMASHTQPSPPTPSDRAESRPAPGMTPKIWGFITPKQVFEIVNTERGNREGIAQQFKGLAVFWELNLLSANRQELTRDQVLLLFAVGGELDGSKLVVCEDVRVTVSLEERLSAGNRFLVSGVIDDVSPLEIRLKEANIEPISLARY